MSDDQSIGVIYVEDDDDVRIGGVQALELAGFSVSGFVSVETAGTSVRSDMPFVVVCDVRLRGKSGLEWLSDLRRLDQDLPVILITGHGDISMAVQAMRNGAYDFIEKPCFSEQLVSVVRRAAEKRQLTLEVRSLRSALADRQGIELSLLGRSPQIQEVRRLVSTLAATNVDVTIYGETGTGKDVVARCLHNHSVRRGGHYVAVNCGGLPESLVESELFGHEVGAFTGATRQRIGKIEYANGGTLFLDEIESDESVASVTLLTTMLDFREPGDLGVFVDEEGVRQREQTIGNHGIYRGAELGFVFQTLRSKELIWPNVINNYLKGKSPERFDLLFWNADVTNLPGPMYCWYIRNMYLENNLREPNRLTMCNTPVDLGRVDLPAYVLATVEDHIVPWRSAYRTTGLFGGETRFVLGASGHIAGVINPASKNKRSYWVSTNRCEDPATWLASADEKPGSWWNDWIGWLKPWAEEHLPARTQLGSNLYPPGESAPGRYVKAKAS